MPKHYHHQQLKNAIIAHCWQKGMSSSFQHDSVVVPRQFSEILAKIFLTSMFWTLQYGGSWLERLVKNPTKVLTASNAASGLHGTKLMKKPSVLVARMLARGSRPWWRLGVVILKTSIFF